MRSFPSIITAWLESDSLEYSTIITTIIVAMQSGGIHQRINRCDNNMSPPKMERFFVNEIISDGSVGK